MVRFDMFSNSEEIASMYDGGVFHFEEWGGDTWRGYNPNTKIFLVFIENYPERRVNDNGFSN